MVSPYRRPPSSPSLQLGWLGPVSASLLLHLLFLALAASLGWEARLELANVLAVDLLRPAESLAAPPSSTDAGNRPPSPPPSTDSPKEPLAEQRQETVNLESPRVKYAAYTRVLRRRIYSHWNYPRDALAARLTGKLLVEFSVSSTGSLTALRIIDSSGHGILDQGALSAIAAAAPFPPLPPAFGLDRLNVRARFVYTLVAAPAPSG